MNNEQVKRARALKALACMEGTADPKKVELVGEPWLDDHILCASFTVDDVPLCWPWCGWEGVAALTYWNESQQARADVAEQLRQVLDGMSDEDMADHFAPDVLGGDHG